ncbi:hypothetical protein IKZ77_01055 [Candidatus Saccharibacteria bacterium]|nr:hypothetical protein [Candidatus Saccharibacteria bacterium]
MDQIQSVDNDDLLKKAIDSIANTTNTDSVFSDPVAAPTPVQPMNIPDIPTPTTQPEPDEVHPVAPIVDAPEPIQEPVVEPSSSVPDLSPVETISAQEIKKAALNDLAPILNSVEMEPAKKFNIYRNILEENLHDYTVLDSAYKSAREISDKTERANALLYLVELIDKM